MSTPSPTPSIRYRPLAVDESGVLRKMLYIALYVRPGEVPFPARILDEPELAKYITDWGSRPLDQGIVALYQGQIIGVIWGRAFTGEAPGYGFIAEDIPEISIAVLANFRNRGIGRQLLHQIEEAYRELGVRSLSLSVDQMSPAKRLYTRLGFSEYKEEGTAMTMHKTLVASSSD